MSLRDELFDALNSGRLNANLKRKPIVVWGKDLWVWEIGADERDAYEGSRVEYGRDGKAKLNYRGSRAKLVVLSLRDSGADDAKCIFLDGDEAMIGRMGANEVDRIYVLAARLSGITAGTDEELEAKKKHESESESSSFDSPATSNGQALQPACAA